MKIRDAYFDVKDTLKTTNIKLLQHLAKEFFDYLKNLNADYTKPDFPNAEDYYEKKIHNEFNAAIEHINKEFSKLMKLVFGGGKTAVTPWRRLVITRHLSAGIRSGISRPTCHSF